MCYVVFYIVLNTKEKKPTPGLTQRPVDQTQTPFFSPTTTTPCTITSYYSHLTHAIGANCGQSIVIIRVISGVFVHPSFPSISSLLRRPGFAAWRQLFVLPSPALALSFYLTKALCQFPITAIREIKILRALKSEHIVQLKDIISSKCTTSPNRPPTNQPANNTSSLMDCLLLVCSVGRQGCERVDFLGF